MRTVNPTKKVLTFGFDKITADPSLLEKIDDLDSIEGKYEKRETGEKSRSKKTI